MNAKDSDPIALAWMQGSPPSPEKIVQFANGSNFQFPQLRWAFSHSRELVPSYGVYRGSGASAPLALAHRSDLDGVMFTPLNSTTPMTWGEAFDANFTDGIAVLHRGKLVYERYAGALTEYGQHISMSVTKSFTGTIAATLVANKALDETKLISHYIPELEGSAFADATVRQVMDMRTGLQYSEDYSNPTAEVWNHARAGNVLPRPPGYAGPDSFYAFLKTVKKLGEHGAGFTYKTVNTDVLGWLIRRVTGKQIGELISDWFWQKLGMEQDANIAVDGHGTQFAGGGLSTGLRDLARFGDMMRCEGSHQGSQLIPASVVQDIARGGDKSAFGGYPLLPGWSYRNMWWVSHNEHGAYMARGIHGQAIYIDPKAEMVIARYASFPQAANAHLDPTSLPAYHAIAKALRG